MNINIYNLLYVMKFCLMRFWTRYYITLNSLNGYNIFLSNVSYVLCDKIPFNHIDWQVRISLYYITYLEFINYRDRVFNYYKECILKIQNAYTFSTFQA